MLIYSENDNFSIDKASAVGDFAPIIIIDRTVKELTGTENNLATLKARGNLNVGSGYAIFTNDPQPEVVESAPGYAAGGEIYVFEDYIGIFYSFGGDHFTVHKQTGDVEMRCEFSQICPINYISSTGAQVIGIAPSCYLPLVKGGIETYDTNLCANAPEFEQAFFRGGVPAAYFGVETGSLGINVIPTTKVGIAKMLGRNCLSVPEARKYSALEGVFVSQTERGAAKSVLGRVAAGSKASFKGFCKKYLRPASLLYTISKMFYTLQIPQAAAYDSYPTICFLPNGRFPGFGLKDYINNPGPDHDFYVYGDPHLDEILQKYQRRIDSIRLNSLKEGVVLASTLITNLTEKVRKVRIKVEADTSISTEIVKEPINVFCQLNSIQLTLPEVNRPSNYMDVVNGSDSMAMKTMYIQLHEAMAVICDLLKSKVVTKTVGTTSVDINEFDIDENALKSYEANITDELNEGLVNTVKEIFNSLTMSSNRYGLGDMAVTTGGGGCGSSPTTTIYPLMGSTPNLGSMAQDIKSTPTKNNISNFIIENVQFNKTKQKYESVISFSFFCALNGTISILANGYDLGYSLLNAMRGALEARGISAQITLGAKVENPCGASCSKVSAKVAKTKYKSNYGTSATDDNGVPQVVAPGFWYHFRVAVPFKFSMPSLATTAESFMAKVYQNVENIETLAQVQALKELINDLESAGLLKNVVFAGKLENTLVRLRDFVKFCDYDVSQTLMILYQSLKRIQAQQEGGLNLLDNDTIAGVRASLNEIELAFQTMGCSPSYSNGSYSLVKGQRDSVPWLASAATFAPQPIEEDLNLLGIYSIL